MPEQTGIQIAIIRLSGSVNGEIQGNVPSTDMGGLGGSGFLSSVSSLPERLRAIQANLLMSLPNSGQLKQHLQKM